MFVPGIVVRLDGLLPLHLGGPGLWAKVHATVPVGGGVVLLGGITLAVNVKVAPRIGAVAPGMGGFWTHDAVTRTVV